MFINFLFVNFVFSHEGSCFIRVSYKFFFPKIIGAEDPRCPLAGLDVPKARALKAYEDSHSIDNFKVCSSTSRGKEIITLRALLPIQLPLN